jgi:2'-5' RNA ligase
MPPAPRPPPQPDRPLRLFLALWPGPAVRLVLQARQREWRWSETAARVAPERLHLTLHFLGDVPRDRLPELRQGLQVDFERFELVFAAAALWPRGVAVLLPAAAPPALLALHAELKQALQSLRVPTEARAFRPHLTLARHAEGSLAPDVVLPIRWSVRGYALVSSERGQQSGYRIVARYA